MSAFDPKIKFTESSMGKWAGWLLVFAWVVSLIQSDEHAYSAWPTLIAVIPVVGLFLISLLMNRRLVRMPIPAWISLAVGGWFLWRCSTSYSLIDSWKDSSLILIGMVFYLAGVYAADGCRGRIFIRVIAVALVLNLAAIVYLQRPDADVIWLGRSYVGIDGENAASTSLFIYKNFTALFLFVCGSSILFWILCKLERGWRDVALALLALAGIAVSFNCGSRVVWLALPVFCLVGWILWLVFRMYEQKPVGWWSILVSVGIFVLCSIVCYDIFLGHHLFTLASDLNTHLRYHIWESASSIALHGPLTGYGAGALQWEIASVYDEWHLPNMAHNEYLQAWLDYGIVGALLLLFIVVLHLARGMMTLTSEKIDPERRLKTMTALVAFFCILAAAWTDFVWHNIPLVAMTSFICGNLVAPFPYDVSGGGLFSKRWAPGSSATLRPLRPQHKPGRCGLVLVSLGALIAVGGLSVCLQPAWFAQWEYRSSILEFRSLPQQAAVIDRAFTHYPDSRVFELYLNHPGSDRGNRQKLERMAREVLAANPRQLFTVTLLSELLRDTGRYAEAEQLLRNHYPGDGPDNTCLRHWSGFYSWNLLCWGRAEMLRGNYPHALSLLNYVGKMRKKSSVIIKFGSYTRGDWYNPELVKRMKQIETSAKIDHVLLLSMDIQPDDSWQEPAETGGKPSLYRRWVFPEETSKH